MSAWTVYPDVLMRLRPFSIYLDGYWIVHKCMYIMSLLIHLLTFVHGRLYIFICRNGTVSGQSWCQSKLEHLLEIPSECLGNRVRNCLGNSFRFSECAIQFLGGNSCLQTTLL